MQSKPIIDTMIFVFFHVAACLDLVAKMVRTVLLPNLGEACSKQTGMVALSKWRLS